MVSRWLDLPSLHVVPFPVPVSLQSATHALRIHMKTFMAILAYVACTSLKFHSGFFSLYNVLLYSHFLYYMFSFHSVVLPSSL